MTEPLFSYDRTRNSPFRFIVTPVTSSYVSIFEEDSIALSKCVPAR